MAVLQALGPAAVRPADAGLGVPGRVHAALRHKAPPTCCAPMRSRRTRSCGSRRSIDSRWDFTLYSEGMLALQGEETNYIGVDALIKQPTMDPAYVSVADYVKALRREAVVRRRSRSRRRSSPNCSNATAARRLRLVGGIDTAGDASLCTKSPTCKAWATPRPAPGGKTCAAPWRCRPSARPVTTSNASRPSSICARRSSYWDEVIRITRPLYKDMKLTHYNGNSFDANPDNLFHWERSATKCADIEVPAPAA